MEIFQTIWNMLTTPNEELTTMILQPLILIELSVAVLLFSTILNIKCSTKQKILFIF